jgi:hypothetical protein
MILLFAGGCDSSDNEDTVTSLLDGTNNIPCGGLSVTQDDTIYYVGEWEEGGEAIYAMDLSGENVRTIYTPERYKNMLSYLNIYNDRLYFCEEVINDDFMHDETQINVLDLSDSSDSSVEKVYGTGLLLSSIYFYKDHIYFGESRNITSQADFEEDPYSDYQIKVMDPDGKNPTLITNYADEFIVYDDMLYYIDGKGLSRCALDGKHNEIIYEDENGIAGLQIVDGKLYFVEYRFEAAPYFMLIDLDGGNPQKVFEDEFSGGLFMANAIDHKIYLGTEEYLGLYPEITLITVNLDGSGKGTIVSTDDYGVMRLIEGGWCISGDWMFYAELDDHNGRTLYKEKRTE